MPDRRAAPALIPERRGSTRARLQAARGELILAVLVLPAAFALTILPSSLAGTAVGTALPGPLPYVWLALLWAGAIHTLGGHLTGRPGHALAGVLALSWAFLIYAGLLTPERPGRSAAALAASLAWGLYLVARAHDLSGDP